MSNLYNQKLKESDPEVYQSLEKELIRQQNQIELIASENICSLAVLNAQGSIMTNKYAEGYPHKRYYGGCEFVDQAEEIALERVKKLYNCKYANLQSHSGAQANQAVFLALLKPHDTILGMSLASGGHLTHGAKPNISGKWFNSIQYGVKKEGNEKDLIDYEEVERLAKPFHVNFTGFFFLLRISFASPVIVSARSMLFCFCLKGSAILTLLCYIQTYVVSLVKFFHILLISNICKI